MVGFFYFLGALFVCVGGLLVLAQLELVQSIITVNFTLRS